jgi:cytochrome P450
MTMTATDLLPVYDFMALPQTDDPYPLFREMRDAGPIVKAVMPLTFAVTRHADVSALLRDSRLGHEFPRQYMEFMLGDGPGTDFMQNILLNRDAPDHTRLRTLMAKAFRGLVVRKLHDHIGDLVNDLLDAALAKGSFDVVADLAFPLPVQVICELLGFPHVDREEVRKHAVRLVGQDIEAMHASTTWLREYVGAVLSERRPDPDGDLLERMLAAEEGTDALSHEEIVDNALLVFFAGFETTSNLIATGCAALLEHPAERRKLWADPTLSSSAVEEFLRYDGPLTLVQRLTREPVEIGGRRVKEMRVILLLLGSANHDEDVFTEPERLDITRKPNPHVAFGGGIHHCMGAMLARLEGEVVFRRLAERTSSFEAAGRAERRYGTTVRSFAAVPVTASAR